MLTVPCLVVLQEMTCLIQFGIKQWSLEIEFEAMPRKMLEEEKPGFRFSQCLSDWLSMVFWYSKGFRMVGHLESYFLLTVSCLVVLQEVSMFQLGIKNGVLEIELEA